MTASGPQIIFQTISWAPMDASIRIVLHKKECSHPTSLFSPSLQGPAVVDYAPHWVDVRSGQSFLEWNHNLYDRSQRYINTARTFS